MPVGRNIRHTIPQLRQVTREKVIYAKDMETDGCSATVLGASPVMQFAAGSDQYALADLKIPVDRVPNTPIVVKLVFAGGGGPGYILWYISFLVAGEGQDLTASLATIWERTLAPPPNVQKTTNGMTIQANLLDGKLPSANIQMRIGRQGTHSLDDAPNATNLLKAIFEYTAYV